MYQCSIKGLVDNFMTKEGVDYVSVLGPVRGSRIASIYLLDNSKRTEFENKYLSKSIKLENNRVGYISRVQPCTASKGHYLISVVKK